MEFLDIVSDDNEIIGRALRRDCHGNPHLIHRTAHVLLFNSKGRLLLQKRSKNKDIQPGKWDTSVGGHVGLGESYEDAAVREMWEELGIRGIKIDYLYDYKMRNEVESENIRSFESIYDVTINFNKAEIDSVRFWAIDEIRAHLGEAIFTPNFEQEFDLYTKTKHS